MTDSSDMPKADSTSAEIRLAAMNLLARREHAQAELVKKLSRRFSDADEIHRQLLQLANDNLQSDTRYAQSLVRQRIGRGHGPVRIRNELCQQHVDQGDIDAAIAEAAPDWPVLAREVLERKFGSDSPVDMKDKARRIRFLQYRGFEPDHYQALLRG